MTAFTSVRAVMVTSHCPIITCQLCMLNMSFILVAYFAPEGKTKVLLPVAADLKM